MDLSFQIASLDDVPDAIKQSYIEDGSGGYRLKVSGYEDPAKLKNALQKERDAAKNAKNALAEIEKRYDGVDPEKYQALIDAQKQAEDAKLSDQERLAKQTAEMQSNNARKVEKLQQESIFAIERERKRAKDLSQRLVGASIRSAAVQAGLHVSAYDDAVRDATVLFEVSVDGEVVVIEDGEIKIGPDGKTPYGPFEWLDGMRFKKPHWFPAGSSGGGSTSGGSGIPGKKTMKRSIFESLTIEDQAGTMRAAAKGNITIID